jgi:DNA-binding transcriptional ArsR family regulator
LSVSPVESPEAVDEPTLNRRQSRAANRQTKRLRKDPHRRRRFLTHVRSDHSVIRSAIATLEALLEHSSDTADPVWPSQARLATLTGVDVRTVQRHLKELRDAGYLLVFFYSVERDLTTGRYRRRKTNRYYFIFCNSPGNGHRVRRNRRSHLDDTDDVSNPLGIGNHRPTGGGGGSSDVIVERNSHIVTQGPFTSPVSRAQSSGWSDEKGCLSCDQTGWILAESGFATRCSCSTSSSKDN